MSKRSGSPSERNPVKGQRRSSPDDDGGGKVGILVQAAENYRDLTEYQIYVVEVDSPAGDDEYTLINPSIRVATPDGWAACVLHSAVYLFAGHTHLVTYPDAEKRAMKCYFSLRQEYCDPKLLEEKDLIELPSMRYSKCMPKAVPTPDGNKILVFQYFIDRCNPDFAIELYDPSTEVWTNFPGFPLEAHPSTGPLYLPLLILKSTFLSDSIFCIETERGVLTLNIETKLWALSDYKFSWKARLHLGRDYYPAIDNTRYSLLPGAVFDRCDEYYYRLPLSDKKELERPHYEGKPIPKYSSAVVDGDDDGKVYHICTGEAEVGVPHDEPGLNPRIIIDVCCINLNNKETKLIKSLKFRLKLHRTWLWSIRLISI